MHPAQALKTAYRVSLIFITPLVSLSSNESRLRHSTGVVAKSHRARLFGDQYRVHLIKSSDQQRLYQELLAHRPQRSMASAGWTQRYDSSWKKNVIEKRIMAGYITRDRLLKRLMVLFQAVESEAEFRLDTVSSVDSSPSDVTSEGNWRLIRTSFFRTGASWWLGVLRA